MSLKYYSVQRRFIFTVCNPEKEFQCKNGLCVPALFVCDNDDDCNDDSDEEVRFITIAIRHLTLFDFLLCMF